MKLLHTLKNAIIRLSQPAGQEINGVLANATGLVFVPRKLNVLRRHFRYWSR